jgi:hypothetical protein
MRTVRRSLRSKHSNADPDSRCGVAVRWSWLVGGDERLTEAELNEMANELRRWTAEFHEAAQKVGKPGPTYRINPDGSYEGGTIRHDQPWVMLLVSRLTRAVGRDPSSSAPGAHRVGAAGGPAG